MFDFFSQICTPSQQTSVQSSSHALCATAPFFRVSNELIKVEFRRIEISWSPNHAPSATIWSWMASQWAQLMSIPLCIDQETFAHCPFGCAMQWIHSFQNIRGLSFLCFWLPWQLVSCEIWVENRAALCQHSSWVTLWSQAQSKQVRLKNDHCLMLDMNLYYFCTINRTIVQKQEGTRQVEQKFESCPNSVFFRALKHS